MKTTAKDKLLDAGQALMLDQGYRGSSVDAVCEMAGVTKGSMYYHFKTKEDLGIAVLDRWLGNNAQTMMGGTFHEVADPVERVFAYLDHVDESVETLWSRGCLLGSLTMEMAGSSEKIQAYVEGRFKSFAQVHAELFQPVLDASKLDDLPSAMDLAEMFLSGIEGGIVLATSYQSLEPIHRNVASFRLLLKKLLVA